MFVQVDWPFGEVWAFLISMAFGTLVAGIAGLVVGWVIADLDIDGVLVGTLGFATCVWIVATTEQDLTGGALGMGGLGFPYDIGSVKANETLWLVILTIVVALILYYVSRVHKAPYGRLLISIGDNEPLARSLGKQSFRTKLWLFAGSSAVMGLLGAMFGVMERFLDIGNLGIDITLAAMVGLVLGGTTRTWGAVVGVRPHRGGLRHPPSVLPPAPPVVVRPGNSEPSRDDVRRRAHPRAHVPTVWRARPNAKRQADAEDAWRLIPETPRPQESPLVRRPSPRGRAFMFRTPSRASADGSSSTSTT